MITLDLNSVLNSQYRENRGYKKLLSWYFLFRNFVPISWLLKKANRKLAARLTILKEIYAYLVEKTPELKNTDLHTEISVTEKLTAYLYKQRDVLEEHMFQSGLKTLQPSLDITSEIIEVLHSILRLLQKNTLKVPLTNTTEEAALAVNRSNKTMNKLYGR
jgi:NH3-dependent NAD+ synthetase